MDFVIKSWAEWLYVYQNGKWFTYDVYNKRWRGTALHNSKGGKSMPKKKGKKKMKKKATKKYKPRAKYYQIGKTTVWLDKLLPAKKPGRRKSESGNIYYEHRKNRSDMPKSKI